MSQAKSVEKVVQDIRRKTRRRFSVDATRSNGGHWHSGNGRIYTDTDRATGEESLLNLRSNCPDWFDDIQAGQLTCNPEAPKTGR